MTRNAEQLGVPALPIQFAPISGQTGAGGMVEKFGGQEIEARRRPSFAKVHNFEKCLILKFLASRPFI